MIVFTTDQLSMYIEPSQTPHKYKSIKYVHIHIAVEV